MAPQDLPEKRLAARFGFGLLVACAMLGAAVLASGCTGPPTSSAPTPPPRDSPPRPDIVARLMTAYGGLPLVFEANRGQTDRRVAFLGRGHGYSLFLTPSDVVLSLTNDAPRTEARTASAPRLLLQMTFAGAAPGPEIVGLDPLPEQHHYLIGRDPARWHTNVPTFAKVRYRDLYPGIDLAFDGSRGRLEYDFIVAPGADPSDIRLRFTGADALDLDEEGNLLLRVTERTVRSLRPHLYQERGGVRQTVAGRYRLLGGDHVGFSVDEYDRRRPLIIDPILVYSSYLGGTATDAVFGIAVDAAGQAYATGATESADFPATSPLTPLTARDVFVTKLNPAGTGVVYSTFFGGDSLDEGHGIAVDGAGQAYVVGLSASHDYPTTPGAFQACQAGSDCVASTGQFDFVITKLNPDGNALVYSTFLGGSDQEFGRAAITIDAGGHAYVTGATASEDFPTAQPLQPAPGGGRFDAVLAKLAPDGTGLVYSTFLGGEDDDAGRSVAVDPAGNAYLTGYTASLAFPIVNPIQAAFGGGNADAFIAKVTAAGDALVYSTYLGGNFMDTGDGVAADADGNAYLGGTTQSDDFPTVNQIPGVRGTGADAFVAKLDSAGAGLLYSTYVGGNNHDFTHGLAVAADGAPSITGDTFSDNFPLVNAVQTVQAGDRDVFVATLNPAGTALALSTYLGGGSTDIGYGVTVDQAGSLYVGGVTGSGDFPVTAGAFQTSAGGNFDGFAAKIGIPATTTSTTTTSTAASTTTTAPSTTTTAVTSTTSTTSTTTTTTTTTTAPPVVHDVACRLAPNQPTYKIGTTVQVPVVVTNLGTVAETVRVELSGTINYFAAQSTTVPAGGSVTLLFDNYTVPVRLEVTLTATAAITGSGATDVNPANNSDTETYPTTVL